MNRIQCGRACDYVMPDDGPYRGVNRMGFRRQELRLHTQSRVIALHPETMCPSSGGIADRAIDRIPWTGPMQFMSRAAAGEDGAITCPHFPAPASRWSKRTAEAGGIIKTLTPSPVLHDRIALEIASFDVVLVAGFWRCVQAVAIGVAKPSRARAPCTLPAATSQGEPRLRSQ